ncbi:MAG: aspartate aminotransferase family protein [Candidatus Bathyarchaeia archaeon]
MIEKDERYVVHGWGYAPVVWVEQKGSIIKDINGKECIDMLCQTAGPTAIGGQHPRVVEAVQRQAEKAMHFLPSVVNIPRVELAEKLAKVTPKKLTKFFFCQGGTEANECALKAAMKITKKHEVIGLFNGYHGSSFGAMGLTQPWLRQGFPMVPGFKQIPPPYCYRCFYGKEYPDCDFECARMLEHVIHYGSYNDVAAFILELVQGNGGHVHPPSEEYLKIVKETCDKYGVLIIVDEVQTGMGRTGKFWACDYFNFQPDMITIGKPLGGGMPISAAVFRDDMLPPNFEQEQWHAYTHAASPVCCAAASAVVDVVLEEKLPQRAVELGKKMNTQVKKMSEMHEIIGEVRGPGMFIGLELVKDRKKKTMATQETMKVFSKCLNKGVLVGISNVANVGNVIKIKPPLNIPEELAEKGLKIFEEALTETENRSGLKK